MTGPGLHHRLCGDGPPLLLGPSLGTSLAVWEPQMPALARERELLRWDLPGHGGSDAGLLPSDGSATVGQLAALVLRLADAQGWERFAYAGISLGGAVGLHLAVHHPERLTSLALVCSSAHFGDRRPWLERAALVRAEGTEPLVAASANRWFSRVSAPGTGLLEDLRATDPAGYAACCDALAGFDLRDRLGQVTTPTLVLAGRDDPAAPPAHGRELVDGIAGAGLTEIAHAAHLANVDQPQRVTAALRAHFAVHVPGHRARPEPPAGDYPPDAPGTPGAPEAHGPRGGPGEYGGYGGTI